MEPERRKLIMSVRTQNISIGLNSKMGAILSKLDQRIPLDFDWIAPGQVYIRALQSCFFVMASSSDSVLVSFYKCQTHYTLNFNICKREENKPISLIPKAES